MGQFLKQRGFVLYVSMNMLVCAIVFMPWALPRETISGLMGRWRLTETGWKARTGVVVGFLIDRVYFWESDHCRDVWECECSARKALYP